MSCHLKIWCPNPDNPYLVTFLIRIPIFECYVVWCCCKNRYQKGTCFEEIGMCALIMITALGLTSNITYMTT